MTMISRVLGFVRDVVLARMFGADAATDAFFVAFKIPNFLRRLFAEGAFAQSFVPVFTEYKEKRDPQDLKLLVDQVAGVFGGFLLVLTSLGVLAAPVLVGIFGPGFLDEPFKYDLAVEMLAITFPYLFFIALTAFAGGILNSCGSFGVPAFTPVLLNVSLISAALWLSPEMDKPIVGLAWGVFIAGAAQLLFQFPFLARKGLLPRPRWAWKAEGVQRIMKLMLPAIFGSSVVQINLLLDTLIASFLISGSISWLYYSDRLVEFPLGVFGIALATVILPKLSRDHANKTGDHFSKTIDWSMRLVWLIATPAAVGLAVLSGPLLLSLFYGGEFKLTDVEMSQLSLIAYSIGLLGFIFVKVLAPGFYARQNTKTPVKIGVIAMITNMGLNVAFVVPLYMNDFKGAHMGLALATACSSFLNAFLLYRQLKKEGVYHSEPGWLLYLVRIVLASIAMGGAIWWFTPAVDLWITQEAWMRGLWLLGLVSCGIGIYFFTLLILGVKLKRLFQLKT